MASEFRLKINQTALEIELLNSGQEGLANFLQLLGNNGKHGYKDTVELIQAGPATLSSQA